MKITHVLLLLFLYLFLSSCQRCGLDKNDFKSEFDNLTLLNSHLIANENSFDWDYSSLISQIKEESEAKLSLEILQSNLNLIDIQRYYLNDDSSRLGISYKFQCKGESSKFDHYHFMIYARNPKDKEAFGSYEEFIGYYGNADDFSKHWLYTKNDSELSKDE